MPNLAQDRFEVRRRPSGYESINSAIPNLQCADVGRVVNGRVLEAAQLLLIGPLEVEEFDVNLDMMARDLLLIPLVSK